MSIAKLLERVRAEQLPTGAFVEVELPTCTLYGRVAFVDGSWVHWCEHNGTRHATPGKYVTRST